jgi:hypothetical protein
MLNVSYVFCRLSCVVSGCRITDFRVVSLGGGDMNVDDRLDEMHRELRGRLAGRSERVARHRAELEGDPACAECGRRIGENGRWHSDGIGTAEAYCVPCAERTFPAL